MDDTNEQEHGGGLFDTVAGKGKEYLSDPQNQEKLMSQARERFGNVPGMDQVSGLMGQAGRGAGTSGEEASETSVPSQSDEGGEGGYSETQAGADLSGEESRT